MEIDEKNVNYLISRCILLENRNSRQDKRIKGFEEYIEVHDERIKELEHELAIEADGEEHIGLYVSNLNEENAKLKDRIKELEKINDELLCPERMKALEIRNKDLKNAAKLYQRELVKAEKRIKELEERDYPEELQYE